MAITVIPSTGLWGDIADSLNDNFNQVKFNKQVNVNQLSDLPVPALGKYALLANTRYVIGDSINIGTDSLELASGTAVAGIESITVSITYTGTGDMFIGTDVSAKISNVGIICASGRFINWNDSLGSVLRLVDLGITCDRFALFTGVNSFIRLTNVSPTTITTDGAQFVGSFGALQYQSSLANLSAGDLLGLGTATFVSFRIANVISNVASGATFLNGLIDSGNIVAGGTGSVLGTTISGAGDRLNNISVEDALWQFLLNDDIADTRPDGLLSMQGNTTATVISVAGTPVLIAGTWTVERSSQFLGTVAGRLTYEGGKDATLPLTGSFTLEPVSGGAVNLSIEAAIGGVAVPGSKRTANASAGNPVSITAPWQEVLSTSGFVEWFVTNEDTTVNILVSSGISRVN